MKVPVAAVVLAVVLILLTVLSACTATRPVTGRQLAGAAADITYGRDAKGLCFAFLKSITADGYSVVSFTHVPTEACR